MVSEELAPLVPPGLQGKEEILFGNLHELYTFHSEIFLKDLENCISTTELVALCFVQRVSRHPLCLKSKSFFFIFVWFFFVLLFKLYSGKHFIASIRTIVKISRGRNVYARPSSTLIYFSRNAKSVWDTSCRWPPTS